MPQMDLSQLALLIPQLLLQAKGHPVTSAAFAEGWQKGLALREQEEQKRQATARAEQQAQRQDAWTSAQMGNLQRDDVRSGEQLRLNRATAAFNALDKGFGGITEQSPDVTSAESAGLGLTRRVESMFGMPEASLAGEVGQIAPMVSARNKKRLKDTYKALESRWKDRGGLSALWESNPDVPIEGMGVLPFRQLVEIVGEAPMQGGTAMFPPETPTRQGAVGSFEDYLTQTYGPRPTAAQIAAGRKTWAASDDKPVSALDEQFKQLRNQGELDKQEAAASAQAEAARTRENKRNALLQGAEDVLTELDLLAPVNPRTGQAQLAPGLQTISGRTAMLTPEMAIPSGGPAANALVSLKRLSAEKIVELLNELKQQSRTGATGFGQLSGPELAVLTSASNRLDRSQSEEQLLAALNDIRRLINKSKREAEADRGRSLTGVQPNILAAPNAAPASAPVRRYNPATGKVE